MKSHAQHTGIDMKQFGRTLLIGLSTISIAPLSYGQDIPPSESTVRPFETQQKPLGRVSLSELSIRLRTSFSAVGEARDAKGYVRDKRVLKAHEADLKAFREALRHNQITVDRTPDEPKRYDIFKACRRRLSVALRHVADAFNAYEQANDERDDPNIVIAMTINDAYTAEENALKELDIAVGKSAIHEP